MAAPAPLKQKFVVVGAGPVGSLAALYAAKRGHDVEVYELRGGESNCDICIHIYTHACQGLDFTMQGAKLIQIFGTLPPLR